MRFGSGLIALAVSTASAIGSAARADFHFVQTNLVSDVAGLAARTDPNLKNPWGISSTATSPMWVSNQVTGNSTLYNGAGVPQALVVTVPTVGSGPKGPTGQVANTTTDFLLSNNTRANFIFANLDGSISGWNGGLGTTAQIKVSVPNAIYTGLALATSALGSTLYAADVANGRIDVFNGAFTKTSLSGSFTDPGLPSGFTPYNIQNLNGTLYVTYENQATGGGIVSAFDVNGNFLRRIAANGAAGPLQSPWGVAIAPATFNPFAGKLLVGNEDDGRISVFDPTTGDFLGQLRDQNGNFLSNPGLWGLQFGNGGNGGNVNTLYFAAGINNEQNGLFGAITAAPEPGSIVLFGLGGVLLLVRLRKLATRVRTDATAGPC